MTSKTSMPTDVFVEAVRLAQMPCEDGQDGHAAVKHVTDWWNATVEAEFRGAYGLALYVRFDEDWLSGNPEEHWIDAASWAQHAKPKAEATLLNGKVSFMFIRRTGEEDAYSFAANAVDGSRGFSGGKVQSEASGDAILTKWAHEALSLVPVRFPDIWREVCAEAPLADAREKSE